jgi:O-antigen ligase
LSLRIPQDWQLPKDAESIALWCAFGSSVAVVFSIAISQILLGGAMAALFIGRVPIRLPRISLPLGLFIVGTLIAWGFSPDRHVGLSQVKKIYLYLSLPVIYTTFRYARRAVSYLVSVAAATAIMAGLGCAQYVHKMQQAHAAGKSFYEFYLEARITGLQHHWMMFSDQELFGLLIVGAWLFYAPKPKKQWSWVAIAAGTLISLALVLAETRGIWIAGFFAAIYLMWFWRRIYAMLLPVAAVIAVLLAPSTIQERVISIWHPHAGYTDSNAFRLVCWRTGLRMIEAHPLVGVGPDMQGVRFYDYVPPDVPWPLPTGFYGHLHNVYIQYAADRGIPTMLMMVWMLIMIIVESARKLQKLPPGRSYERFILHTAIACTIGEMISGWSDYNLNYGVVIPMFLAIAASASIVVEGKSGDEPARA